MLSTYTDTRPTGVAPFDREYGGLAAGEVAILTSDVLEHARWLALDLAAVVLRGETERGQRPGQVFYYQAGAHWPARRVEAELSVRLGDLTRWVEVTGVTSTRRDQRIHASELAARARSWVDGANNPVLVIVDALADVGGESGTVARSVKLLALRHPQISVLLLDLHPHGQPPSAADLDHLGDAVDFLAHLTVPAEPPRGQMGMFRPQKGEPVLNVVKARQGASPMRLVLPSFTPPTRSPEQVSSLPGRG